MLKVVGLEVFLPSNEVHFSGILWSPWITVSQHLNVSIVMVEIAKCTTVGLVLVLILLPVFWWPNFRGGFVLHAVDSLVP